MRKWYFCANEAALTGARARLLIAAVRSCRERTDLRPHFVYDGPRHPTLRKLRDMGVEVIRHSPSLEPVLRRGYGDAYDMFRGHWLRIDIPRIDDGTDCVLYTDIDVLFRSMPATLRRPETVAVAPERWRFRWELFNSGVMLMNLPGLRAVDDALRAAVERRLTAPDFRYPPHDQASLQAFFGRRADRLPLTMNWKPYWGVRDDAHIVHFHGPTPMLAADMARGADAGRPAQRALWRQDPEAYAHWGAEYEAIRTRRAPAPATPGSTRIVDAPPPARAARLRADAASWAGDAWRTLRRGDARAVRGLLVPDRRWPV